MPEVIMPKMGDAMEEGTLLQWLKQDGETVKSGDVIAEIETDKSNVEIEAEDAGVLHIQAQPGAVVAVGKAIAMIGDDVKPVESAPSPVAQPAAKPVAAAPSNGQSHAVSAGNAAISNGSGDHRLKASPLARSVARERGIDIAQITGTGPLGRIIEADVLAFQGGAAIPAQPKSGTEGASSTTVPSAPAPLELSPMRKVIAKRMTLSKTTIPHFYLTAEVDMAEAMALRERPKSP